MYILHTHWQPPTKPTESGIVHFWAESALAPQPPRYKRNTKRVLAHPFAADAKTLRQILLPLTQSTANPATGTIQLWLPTTLNGPQPSPGLLHDWTFDGRSKVALATWKIEGLQFSPTVAVELLTRLPAVFELPSNTSSASNLMRIPF